MSSTIVQFRSTSTKSMVGACVLSSQTESLLAAMSENLFSKRLNLTECGGSRNSRCPTLYSAKASRWTFLLQVEKNKSTEGLVIWYESDALPEPRACVNLSAATTSCERSKDDHPS
jgi:hypothetical protein